jgi:hypothetical protein
MTAGFESHPVDGTVGLGAASVRPTAHDDCTTMTKLQKLAQRVAAGLASVASKPMRERPSTVLPRATSSQYQGAAPCAKAEAKNRFVLSSGGPEIRSGRAAWKRQCGVLVCAWGLVNLIVWTLGWAK